MMKTILAENVLINDNWEKDQVLTIKEGVITHIEALSLITKVISFHSTGAK